MKPILHWFRRDLRLADNTALNAAVRAAGGALIPVYIQSTWRGAHRWTGPARMETLCQALAALAHSLSQAGSRLIIRRGNAVEELEKLAAETGARAIYFNRDPDPFGRATEARLARMAGRLGIEARGFDDVTVHPPEAVLTGTGHPFRVFTPYSKAWLRRPLPPVGKTVHSGLERPPERVGSLPLPSLESWGLPPPPGELLPAGEPTARRRMTAFLREPVYRYGRERDFPAAGATSRLSADLRWGALSIRELAARCRAAADEADTAEARKSVGVFLGELIWREFSMAILWHWPEVLEHEFAPAWRGLPWLYPGEKPPAGPLRESGVNPAEALRRWKEGATGFPLVDAGMRQLAATGFMHNRLRMITAMFLTKDLHLDWRLGEAWFMQTLADGEIASNNGGWQWSAGTGADAAPYFRIQNPWTQTARYDALGEMVARWVPELRGVHPAAFQKPPLPGTRLAPGYPQPIIDHARERLITLEVFKAAR